MTTEYVQATIDASPLSRFQIRTFVLCGLVVLLDGFDTLAMGYVAPFLLREWGISKAALGPVFASSLLGLMVGALVFGPAADRFGRKPVLVASTAMFGLCSLLTLAAHDVGTLVAIRFLTGLGLGGAMPNAISLTSEYAPARARATVVMTMFSGFSLGGAFGGLLAGALMRDWGWQAVFVVGGVLPLVLVAWLVVALPESARYLVARGLRLGDVRSVLERIDGMPRNADVRLAVAEEAATGSPVASLFRDGRAWLTALLWFMFFMSLFEIFFISNWMPTVFAGLGVPAERAVVITSLFPIGGTVGTLVLGRFIDSRHPYRVIGIVYAAAAAFVALLGVVGAGATVLLGACSFAAGFCSVGAQVGTNALAAAAYPTAIRSTGVGWALGIGRVGSLASSLLSGVLLSLQLTAFQTFLIGALPILAAAAAAFWISVLPRSVDKQASPGELAVST